MTEVERQLLQTGHGHLIRDMAVSSDGKHLVGLADPVLVERLTHDRRFASGLFYGLHTDVGTDLTDFRSFNGSLGDGSLQIVIDKVTGRMYADVDSHNPYQDVVRWLGHAFLEVIPSGIRKLFRRNPNDSERDDRPTDGTDRPRNA